MNEESADGGGSVVHMHPSSKREMIVSLNLSPDSSVAGYTRSQSGGSSVGFERAGLSLPEPLRAPDAS